MNAKWTIVVALVAGVTGAMLSQVLLSGVNVARAQDAPEEAGPAKLIQAEEFRLVSAAGRVKATLGVAPDGSTVLRLLDSAGSCRAAIGVSSGGQPRVSLFDASQTEMASLTLADGGGAVLKTCGNGGEVLTGSLPIGVMGVGLASDGVDNGGLSVSPNGSPGLYVVSEGQQVWKTP